MHKYTRRTLIVAGLALVVVVGLVMRRTPTPPKWPEAPKPGHTSLERALVGTNGPEPHADIAAKFESEFKPALAKWYAAYGGHIPFKPEDVTMAQFHSKPLRDSYTFMVNGHTLVFAERQDGPRVSYMTAKDALAAMNAMPTNGAMPDVSVPIARADVLKWLKADTGMDYAPESVTIRPTGESGALQGGAEVQVGGQMPDGRGRLLTLTNVTLVFGKHGTLVYYLR